MTGFDEWAPFYGRHASFMGKLEEETAGCIRDSLELIRKGEIPHIPAYIGVDWYFSIINCGAGYMVLFAVASHDKRQKTIGKLLDIFDAPADVLREG